MRGYDEGRKHFLNVYDGFGRAKEFEHHFPHAPRRPIGGSVFNLMVGEVRPLSQGWPAPARLRAKREDRQLQVRVQGVYVISDIWYRPYQAEHLRLPLSDARRAGERDQRGKQPGIVLTCMGQSPSRRNPSFQNRLQIFCFPNFIQ